jgi:hypothetical protein
MRHRSGPQAAPADEPLYPTSAVLRALLHFNVLSGDAVSVNRRTFITTVFQTMNASKRKSVLIIGGGAVGAIAALNLEVGSLAEVTLVLRSNYSVVNESGYNFESCDHGSVKAWKPCIGALRSHLLATHLTITPSSQHHPLPHSRIPSPIRLYPPLH